MKKAPLVINNEEDELEFRMKLPIAHGDNSYKDLHSYLSLGCHFTRVDFHRFVLGNQYLLSKIIYAKNLESFYLVSFESWITCDTRLVVSKSETVVEDIIKHCNNKNIIIY